MNWFLNLKNDYTEQIKQVLEQKIYGAGKVIVKSIPMTADMNISGEYGKVNHYRGSTIQVQLGLDTL